MKSLAPVFLFVITSCGSASEDKVLIEAAKVHDEAMTVSVEVSSALESIENHTDALSDLQKEELDKLKQDFEEWSELVVEVPGYEHKEQHHHGHDHRHGPNELEGLTPQQILDVQKELKRQIEVLNDRQQELSKNQTPGEDGV